VLRRGAMSGCHWARKVIAGDWSVGRRAKRRGRRGAGVERTPHDVAGGEGEDQRAAPDSAED
jgi:hypothetical protein